jgi:hypothetical protein
MKNGRKSMVMSGKLLRPSDHMMVGVTACMLYICYKMAYYSPVYALLLSWFHMRLFDVYCFWRKNAQR